jgi:transcriptional regulator with XRE-family HTH domain
MPIEPFYRDFGQRVRDLRVAKHMTQERLGDLLRPRMTRASIANIEAGKQRSLVHTLPQLAAALDCSLEALVPRQKQESDPVKDQLAEKLNLTPGQIDSLISEMGEPT